jgi:methyl-accepting chemotaxis protein
MSNKIRSLKIRQILITAFAIVLMVSSLSGVIGIIQANTISSEYHKALNTYGFAQGTIGRLSSEFKTAGQLLEQ